MRGTASPGAPQVGGWWNKHVPLTTLSLTYLCVVQLQPEAREQENPCCGPPMGEFGGLRYALPHIKVSVKLLVFKKQCFLSAQQEVYRKRW